jgi:hydroxymethylpyrimidine/phosphomethylpyrimidine kinase
MGREGEDAAMQGTNHGGQFTRGVEETATGNVRRAVVLSIAGFDPSSGAGVTADLKVFAAFGLYGMACVTALTVQSTQGVGAVEPVREETVAETLQMLAADVDFAGVKIGMLATAGACRVAAEFLEARPEMLVVLDPVLESSSGRELLDAEGLRCLRDRLLPRVDWITPNLAELAVLTGRVVRRREQVPEAAERLRGLGAECGNERLHILVTGGHLERPEDYLLAAGASGRWISGERVETRATHGTGCAFSSALLSCLMQGDEPESAAIRAKAYVTEALRAAYPVGRGRGPMHHLFALDSGGW